MFRQVNQEALGLVLSGPPKAISNEILALCNEIAPTQTPSFIELAPPESAQVRECFFNVLNQVEKAGGELVYRWAIWEWPGVFIEAEHHAVWLLGDRMVDVTPHEYPADRVLFLPDPSAVYDFENATRRNNWKRSISTFAATEDWIAATDRMHFKLESCSVGREYRLSASDQRELMLIGEDVARHKAEILLHLANAKRPNAVCFCRSGRKFKKCCAGLFR